MKKIHLLSLLLGLCFFSIPLGSGFNRIIGFDSSKLFLIFTIISFVLYTIINFRSFNLNFKTLSFFYLFTFFILFHTLIYYFFVCPNEILNAKYTSDPIFVNLIRMIILSVFTFLVIDNFSVDFIKKNTKYFNIGYIISFFGGFFLNPFLDKATNSIVAADNRFYGGFDNPNTFAATSFSLLFLNLLSISLNKENSFSKKVNFSFIILAIIGIIMSQSRTMILLSVIFLILSYSEIILRSLRKVKIKWLIITFIIIIITPIVIPQKSIDSLINRFKSHSIILKSTSNSNKSKIAESRVLIFKDYISKINNYWVHGVGYDREISVIEKDYSTWRPFVPHNRYLSILVQFGFLGLLIYFAFLMDVFLKLLTIKYFVNSLSVNLIFYFFVAWLLYFLMGQQNNSRDYYLMLGFVLGVISLHLKKSQLLVKFS